MTREALQALELLKLEKQAQKELDDIVREFPLINKDNVNDPRNQTRLELRKPANEKLVAQKMRFANYCKDHPSIKAELEPEIKKLNSKIRSENEKFDKETRVDRDILANRREKAERSRVKRAKLKKYLPSVSGAFLLCGSPHILYLSSPPPREALSLIF